MKEVISTFKILCNPNWFRVPGYIGIEDQLDVLIALEELAKKIKWEAGPTDMKDHGVCRTSYIKTPGQPDDKVVKVKINPFYIDVFGRGRPATSRAVSWTPGTDEESAKLRCSALCAIKMVHEIMHALETVIDAWPASGTNLCPEPFYVDARIAELGF